MRLWMFVLLAVACGSSPQRLTKASSAVFVRSDTDHTTIVTPKVEVAGQLAKQTSLDVTYEVDAWTGASVDVVTAATPAIHEIRNEVNAGLGQELGALRLNAGYRFSTEPDYLSHGLVLGARLDLAHKNTTLGVDALASSDTVGRAGDPYFEQPLFSAGGRLSLAQVIDAATLAEVAWETTRLDGYQASPYRWVGVGGEGTCASLTPFCIPEHVPDVRNRSDVFVRARRALARDWSAGLEYRFYFDDWGLRSHAVQPDVAWRISPNAMLSVRYRYYTQNDAEFYRPRYADLMSGGGYVTRDRKLSAFYSHEVGASYLHRIELCEGDRVLLVGARSGLSRLAYLDFVGLNRVYAVELTALFGLELP